MLKAIYIDYKLIPESGQANIKDYAKTPTYYASSADLAVELEVTKFQLQQIRDEHANTKNKRMYIAFNYEKHFFKDNI